MARSVPRWTWRPTIRRIVELAGTGAEVARPEGNDTVEERFEDLFSEELEADPLDDEPFSPEDRAADRGWNEYLRGQPRPLDEVRRRLLVGSETDRGRRTAD